MSYPVKIAIFITLLLAGSFLIYAFSPILTYLLVSLTGQGWLFFILKWILLAVFWALMFWKLWPRKT